jgi:hypothetical protein
LGRSLRPPRSSSQPCQVTLQHRTRAACCVNEAGDRTRVYADRVDLIWGHVGVTRVGINAPGRRANAPADHIVRDPGSHQRVRGSRQRAAGRREWEPGSSCM